MAENEEPKRILHSTIECGPITKRHATHSPEIGPDGEFVSNVTVKKVEWDEFGNKCKGCGFGNDSNYVGTNYCPGCGAKIVKGFRVDDYSTKDSDMAGREEMGGGA